MKEIFHRLRRQRALNIPQRLYLRLQKLEHLFLEKSGVRGHELSVKFKRNLKSNLAYLLNIQLVNLVGLIILLHFVLACRDQAVTDNGGGWSRSKMRGFQDWFR